MAKKKTSSRKVKSKKSSKRPARPDRPHTGKSQRNSIIAKPAERGPTAPDASMPARPSPSQSLNDAQVFTIEIDSIRAETTIGDLIVAFPKTRDVLMKHGLSFDVEEAGYLYMTLNVFSAIHGLVLAGLLQELDVASKELPLPPLSAPIRQIVTPQTT
jgi:hypothetical protein